MSSIWVSHVEAVRLASAVLRGVLAGSMSRSLAMLGREPVGMQDLQVLLGTVLALVSSLFVWGKSS